MLPVTDGLGENAAGALNALVPVPVSGGGRRPYARGLSIRTSLFPYSTVAGARAPVDSHDSLSAFEATGVDNCACDRGASSQGPLICVRVLSSCASVRVPLTDTLDTLICSYEFDIDSLLLFPPPQEEFRLVINQSVGSCREKLIPEVWSCLSAVCYQRLSPLY